jgi:hypothetical protein
LTNVIQSLREWRNIRERRKCYAGCRSARSVSPRAKVGSPSIELSAAARRRYKHSTSLPAKYLPIQKIEDQSLVYPPVAKRQKMMPRLRGIGSFEY